MNDLATAPRTGSAQMQGTLWNARARDYAEVMEGFFRPLYESALSRPELANASSCLDIGCGPGLAAKVFTQKIAAVSGIDATAAFVEIARERLPGRDFRVGDMETLPFADASFDVVTGFNAFQYAASPRHAIGQARRVTKPGGIIVVATWGLPEDCDAAGHLKALGGLMPPPPPGAPGPFALSGEVQAQSAGRRSGPEPDCGDRCGLPLDFPQPRNRAARHAVLRARRTRHSQH